MLARAAEPRMVFAHYMLYEPDSVETLKKEIELAHNKGIDAFALNSNVWRVDRADNMFKAAQESGTGFKLFFSADMHRDDQGSLSRANLTTMLTRYANHSNHLTYNGKLFFSAWLDENTPWLDVFKEAGGKDKFVFIPLFPTEPTLAGVRNKLEEFKDVIDGLFAWDTSAWPYTASNLQNPPPISSDQNFLNACSEKGKIFMASPSPWFFKNIDGSPCPSDECQVKGNYEGPGLWIEKWKQLIDLNPPLLQIVTWNDWVESSYVAPPYSAAAAKNGASAFKHNAFLEMGEHYIKWYKSGNPPQITQDSLYMFYYTQPKSIAGTADGGPVKNSEALTDNLYVTTVLTNPATVELKSGGDSKSFDAPAGINTYSMPFQVGKQSAILKQGATVVSTLDGEIAVTNSTPPKANLNVYSTCTKCSYA
ncbi:hypothetical protein KI387_032471 [Taxus chinensis]|uniref:Uncharacterized protein n=1 Tax=Taxus chinensis TaxID=29808 RepID=A0AA38EZM9_TAXCH|nr:hypothetical protein KI387_032471 [Taxus chinensis]